MVLVAVQLVAMVAVYFGPLVGTVVWQTLKVGRLPRPCIWDHGRALQLLLWLEQRHLHLLECYYLEYCPGVLSVWLVLASCPAALKNIPLSQVRLLLYVLLPSVLHGRDFVLS